MFASSDKLAYDNYVSMLSLDPTTDILRQFHEYCCKYNPTTFQELKRGFESYWLADIITDPKLSRDYRAFVREHGIKQGKSWVMVYNKFCYEYMYKTMPELYREFVVFNTRGKNKVIEFYKWLDDTKSTHPTMMVSSVTDETDAGKLEKKAYRLYRQKDMWKLVKKGKIVDEWHTQLESIIHTLINIQLTNLYNIRGKSAKRNYYVYEITRVILRFHRCFHTPGFAFGDGYELFIKTCIKKCLEMMSVEGIPEGMYLLAKIRPDILSDDCCSLINVYTDEYYNTNMDKILTNRVFHRLCWCHKYWSEEYHMGVLFSRHCIFL